MKFYYHARAGESGLVLEGEILHQLVRVKRQKSGRVDLVNFKDGAVYTYELSAGARSSELKAQLVSSRQAQDLGQDLTQDLRQNPSQDLRRDPTWDLEKDLAQDPTQDPRPALRLANAKGIHLAWAVVDPKTLEKTLPFLNELGVEKLSFVWTHRSQRNFAPNLPRLEKIAINSSCQCGRTDLMRFEVFASLREFLSAYPNASYLDFGGKERLANPPMPLLIGAEGGFAREDLEALRGQRSFCLDHTLTLKSQTAIIAAAASFIFV
ncbi:MAG: RsmE family RNA methyltransferase [Helicobacteraceae bacterium]